MPPDFRRRVDAALLSAAGLDPDEQAAFLAELAASDKTVAAEVERRLRAAEHLPENFLQAPATDVLLTASAPAVEPPPEGDERYEIGERLGAGGMAEVYRAFDHQLGRPVALKILHTAPGQDDPARRLLREARAQARVRHDHVLDVYETGKLHGRPYIAVRLVEGGTLETAPGSLNLEQRVRLLAQAAEGLHAAHREGLLHGDIKPSNILLEETPDGTWKAWIGDFGIALDLAAESGGELAGTPGFLAPERLRQDATVDRRADVYALGAALHQVLTGAMPEAGPGKAGDLAALRRRAPHLPADLAAIVCRCLAEDPAERYPSARAVAEELHRFLDGEVVEAHADRFVYRLSRFVGRHRALVTLGGVSALLLLVASIVAGGLGVRAVQANQRAEQRRAQAENLISFTLLDLRDRLDTVGRLDLLDVVGERAMEYFAAVPEAELSDTELTRRSQALYQLGDVRLRQGDPEAAERPLTESLALARALAERDPEDLQRLFDLGQSEFWVGFARWKQSDLDAAERHLTAYHDIAVQLAEADPGRRDWQQELAYAHSNLGSVLQQRRQLEAALEHFAASIEIDGRLVESATDPETANHHRFELAASHNTLGVLLEEAGHLDEAKAHYEADLALRRVLVEAAPENQRWRDFLGGSHLFLGVLLWMEGETAAREHLEAARDLFDDLAARDPDNVDWRFRRALTHFHLSRLEDEEGWPERASQAAETAEALLRELMAGADPRALWRQTLGAVQLHRALQAAQDGADTRAVEDRLREAEGLLLPLREATGDPQTEVWLATGQLLRGDCRAAAGDLQAARQAWRAGAALLEDRITAGTRDHRPLWVWAETLQRLERDGEATTARQRLTEMGVALRSPRPVRCL